MSDLYPTFAIPLEQEQGKGPDYRQFRSPLFDFKTGDFVKDSAGKIIMANDQEMFIQWCLKAVYTERFAKMAYGDNYGAQTDAARSEPTRKAQESYLKRTITDAIMADPYQRAVSVLNFFFTWENDSLEIAFEVVAVDGLGATIQVSI